MQSPVSDDEAGAAPVEPEGIFPNQHGEVSLSNCEFKTPPKVPALICLLLTPYI